MLLALGSLPALAPGPESLTPAQELLALYVHAFPSVVDGQTPPRPEPPHGSGRCSNNGRPILVHGPPLIGDARGRSAQNLRGYDQRRAQCGASVGCLGVLVSVWSLWCEGVRLARLVSSELQQQWGELAASNPSSAAGGPISLEEVGTVGERAAAHERIAMDGIVQSAMFSVPLLIHDKRLTKSINLQTIAVRQALRLLVRLVSRLGDFGAAGMG